MRYLKWTRIASILVATALLPAATCALDMVAHGDKCGHENRVYGSTKYSGCCLQEKRGVCVKKGEAACREWQCPDCGETNCSNPNAWTKCA